MSNMDYAKWSGEIAIQYNEFGHLLACGDTTHTRVDIKCYKCISINNDIATQKISKCIKKSMERHGPNTFDYSHILERWPHQLVLKCNKQGHITIHSRHDHMRAATGCTDCLISTMPSPQMFENHLDTLIKQFIETSEQKYEANAFDYSAIRFEYRDSGYMVHLKCSEGHDIEVDMKYHMNGNTKCPMSHSILFDPNVDLVFDTTPDSSPNDFIPDPKVNKFIARSKEHHGPNTFDYSHILEKWPEKITVECIKNGHRIVHGYDTHMSRIGCYICSKGFTMPKSKPPKMITTLQMPTYHPELLEINKFIRMSDRKYGENAFDYSTLSFEGSGKMRIVRLKCLAGHDIETLVKYYLCRRPKCYMCGERNHQSRKIPRISPPEELPVAHETNPSLEWFQISELDPIPETDHLPNLNETPIQVEFDPFI